MKNISLLKYFTIFSLIAFIITGIALGIFISAHISNDKLHNIKDLTLFTLDSVIKPELPVEDFQKPLSQAKINVLNLKFAQIKKLDNIVSIKIWTADGKILYSDNVQVIDKYFKKDREVIEALDGNVIYHSSKIDKDENKYLN